ncbi:MAG: TetR/AcrR family transcriptional regulator [Alphaproteobacteria bacterium]|nr:TetR/AcrR family transcriptional regulator [Alphaproteobacteria bacterium]
MPTVATRERIKAVAAELYVLRGHDGFSFGDIAAAIGTTRANIHHHFGNKRQLMAELIDGFVSDASTRIRHNWLGTRGDFAARLAANIADMRRFHDRFNKAPGDRHVWSPLSRVRLDLPVLDSLAAEALERIDGVYDECIRAAVVQAIAAGEFRDTTPVDDVAQLIRFTLLSCAPMTQDGGGFEEIERLFAALERTILAAWGRNRAAARRDRPAARGPRRPRRAGRAD